MDSEQWKKDMDRYIAQKFRRGVRKNEAKERMRQEKSSGSPELKKPKELGKTKLMDTSHL